MTIRISIKNEDIRDGAVVVVITKDLNGQQLEHIQTIELNAGESTEGYVHSTQQLIVQEVKQP